MYTQDIHIVEVMKETKILTHSFRLWYHWHGTYWYDWNMGCHTPEDRNTNAVWLIMYVLHVS